MPVIAFAMADLLPAASCPLPMTASPPSPQWPLQPAAHVDRACRLRDFRTFIVASKPGPRRVRAAGA